MSDFERMYGEDYAVVHRNGKVTVALRMRERAVMTERYGTALWKAAVRFWVVMIALSLVVWRDSSATAGNAWLVPLLTVGCGGIAVGVAAWTRGMVRDRRRVFSAWTAGLLIPLFFMLALQADEIAVALVSGGGLAAAFAATVWWSREHHNTHQLRG
jgi:hypothetical protein